MKQLTLILLLFSSITINAQLDSLHNFILNNDLTVTYQQIFTSDSLTINDLKKFIASKSNINNVVIQENTITGKIENMRINYEKYGGKYMSTLIILNHNLDANFIVEIKENRYRITIKDFVFTDTESLLAHNTNNTDVNKTKLNDYVVKTRKQTFKTGNTYTKGLEYCHQHFTELFSFSKPEKEDW